MIRCWVGCGAGVAAALFAAFVSTSAAAGRDDVLRHVDPFIGTDGTGHVFPGASVPWGMVAPSPDNADRGWSYSGGYQWRAQRILGFSSTHISGAGIPELGDVLLMPNGGPAWAAARQDLGAAKHKRSERASPGFPAVRLPAHQVRVELTATQRVTLHRYTFDRGGRVEVLVDLQHGLHFVDGPRVTAADIRIDATTGEVSGTVHLKNWVERQASFVLRFDRPAIDQRTLPARPGELAPRIVLGFDLGRSRRLHARVALSTVDIDGARRNLAQADGLDFDAARTQAEAQWAALLGRIRIDAGARFKRIFYSALYRSLLHPSDIADADGRVRGPRGDIIAARGGRHDSTLSLWDTFRALQPLLTLLAPERIDGAVQSLLAHHQQQGYLPLWTAWGRETWTMIGNPALPVIADAITKGFSGFDHREALRAMIETSTRERPDAPVWAQRSWASYDRHGYLPFDLEAGESVSKTLGHGIGDDAVARAARQLGEREIAERFERRSRGWQQLFDPSTRTMRGKDSSGRWRAPFDPLIATSPLNNPGDYTEANAWQYTATPALHDPAGFRAALGGATALERWLDDFTTIRAANPDKHLGQEALIGHLAHGNEPSHHIPWLYAFTSRPDKGHALVRRIAQTFYRSGPAGIVGNDDCGQMSAWLVFATLGFYPVVPAGGSYVLGQPLVRRSTLTLPGRRPLIIERRDTRGPMRARLDGAVVEATAVSHALIAAGGRLVFEGRRRP